MNQKVHARNYKQDPSIFLQVPCNRIEAIRDLLHRQTETSLLELKEHGNESTDEYWAYEMGRGLGQIEVTISHTSAESIPVLFLICDPDEATLRAARELIATILSRGAHPFSDESPAALLERFN
jgi:hypothetical protein